jgi:hypothetical protein
MAKLAQCMLEFGGGLPTEFKELVQAIRKEQTDLGASPEKADLAAVQLAVELWELQRQEFVSWVHKNGGVVPVTKVADTGEPTKGEPNGEEKGKNAGPVVDRRGRGPVRGSTNRSGNPQADGGEQSQKDTAGEGRSSSPERSAGPTLAKGVIAEIEADLVRGNLVARKIIKRVTKLVKEMNLPRAEAYYLARAEFAPPEKEEPVSESGFGKTIAVALTGAITKAAQENTGNPNEAFAEESAQTQLKVIDDSEIIEVVAKITGNTYGGGQKQMTIRGLELRFPTYAFEAVVDSIDPSTAIRIYKIQRPTPREFESKEVANKYIRGIENSLLYVNDLFTAVEGDKGKIVISRERLPNELSPDQDNAHTLYVERVSDVVAYGAAALRAKAFDKVVSAISPAGQRVHLHLGYITAMGNGMIPPQKGTIPVDERKVMAFHRGIDMFLLNHWKVDLRGIGRKNIDSDAKGLLFWDDADTNRRSKSSNKDAGLDKADKQIIKTVHARLAGKNGIEIGVITEEVVRDLEAQRITQLATLIEKHYKVLSPRLIRNAAIREGILSRSAGISDADFVALVGVAKKAAKAGTRDEVRSVIHGEIGNSLRDSAGEKNAQARAKALVRMIVALGAGDKARAMAIFEGIPEKGGDVGSLAVLWDLVEQVNARIAGDKTAVEKIEKLRAKLEGQGERIG